MSNLPNIPGAVWRRYCGVPIDGPDGVVIGCKNEPIGVLSFEEEGQHIEIEICAEHAGLDKPDEGVLD